MASFSFSPCCIVCTVWVVQVWQVELLSCRHLSPFHLSLNLGLLQKRFLSLVTRWTKPVFQTLISFSSLRQCANRREPEYLTLPPAGVLMMTSNCRSVSGAVRCSLHFFFIQQANSIRGRTTPLLILASPGVTKLKVDLHYGLRSSPGGPVVLRANERYIFFSIFRILLPTRYLSSCW